MTPLGSTSSDFSGLTMIPTVQIEAYLNGIELPRASARVGWSGRTLFVVCILRAHADVSYSGPSGDSYKQRPHQCDDGSEGWAEPSANDPRCARFVNSCSTQGRSGGTVARAASPYVEARRKARSPRRPHHAQKIIDDRDHVRIGSEASTAAAGAERAARRLNPNGRNSWFGR
jgi:hypothetical protein